MPPKRKLKFVPNCAPPRARTGAGTTPANVPTSSSATSISATPSVAPLRQTASTGSASGPTPGPTPRPSKRFTPATISPAHSLGAPRSLGVKKAAPSAAVVVPITVSAPVPATTPADTTTPVAPTARVALSHHAAPDAPAASAPIPIPVSRKMPPPSHVPSRIPLRVPSRALSRTPSQRGSVDSTRSIASTLPISSCAGSVLASSSAPRPSGLLPSTSSLPHPVVASSVPTGSSSLPHPAPGPSTSSCPDSAAPGPSKPKRRGGYQPRKVSRARDIAAGLTAFYGSPEQLLSRLNEFDKIWERPLQPNSEAARKRIFSHWYDYMLWAHGNDEAKAKAATGPGSTFPSKAIAIAGLKLIFTEGQSHLKPDTKGWCVRTCMVAVGVLCSYLKSIGAGIPPKEDRVQINNAIRQWAKDGSLPTSRRPKRFLRLGDFHDYLAGCLNYETPIKSIWLRMNAMAMGMLLYATGQRPGGIVISRGYEKLHSEQCLKLKDIQVFVNGWKEGEGLDISLFLAIHWAKHKRHSEADYITVSLHSLSGDHIIADFVLLFVAQALARYAFEEGDALLDMFKDPSKLPRRLPRLFRFKSEVLEQAVFVNSDRCTSETYVAMSHLISIIGKALGFRYLSALSFRYSFARHMVNTMSRADLTSTMGHHVVSNLADTTYQPDDRRVDITARRFDEPESAAHLDLQDFHSSVAFNDDAPPPLTDINDDGNSIEDGILRALAVDNEFIRLHAAWRAAEAPLASVNGGKYTHELDDENTTLPEHKVALDRWLSLMQYRHAFSARLQHVKYITAATTSSELADASAADVVTQPSAATSDADAVATLSALTPSVVQPSVALPLPAVVAPTSTPPAITEDTVHEEFSHADHMETLRCMQSVAGGGGDHPFLSLIRADRENPRYTLLKQYLTLYRNDDIQALTHCLRCYFDESLDKSKREKLHGTHLGQHLISCDANRANTGFQQCPLCGALVDGDWDDVHVEDHYEACYHTLLRAHSHIEPTDNDIEEAERVADDNASTAGDAVTGVDDGGMDEDEANEDGAAAGSDVDDYMEEQAPPTVATRGYAALSTVVRHSRLASTGHGTTVYFCPICLPNEDLSWNLDPKSKQKTHSSHCPPYRLRRLTSPGHLHEHLTSHFSGSTGRPPLQYTKTFKCAFPPCTGETERNLGDTIEHLHHEHGYPLLRSTEGVDPPVPEDDLYLPPDFRYNEDVVFEAKFKPTLLETHRVTLVDKRRKDVRRRSIQAISKVYGVEPNAKGKSKQLLPDTEAPVIDTSNGECSNRRLT